MWPARVADPRHPGRGDGEALRPGWIAQPVCAASSAALPVAAVTVALAVRGSAGVDALAGRVLAGALAANGVGSVGFHGPGDRISHALHDISLTAVVTVCGAGAVRELSRDPGLAVRDLAVPAVTLAAGALLARLGRTGGWCCRPRSPWQPHAAWHLLAAAAVAVAGRRLFAAGDRR